LFDNLCQEIEKSANKRRLSVTTKMID